jgi:hypothetical protein
MSLSCLFPLGDGIMFQRFRKNPFRSAEPRGSPFLISVKLADTRPVQPAIDAQRQREASQPLASIRFTPASLKCHSPAECPPRLLSWTKKVEARVLKLLAVVLGLACIGCGFGIQHIAYVRKENELCRQLRHTELELRNVTQAYRSLESLAVAKAAEDLRRPEACPVLARRATQKAPTRG